MKIKPITFCLLILSTALFNLHLGYQWSEHHHRSDMPVSYVDEMPGIGGTREKPDTAICYVNSTKDSIVVAYLNLPSCKR
jgi:hypothetical protein